MSILKEIAKNNIFCVGANVKKGTIWIMESCDHYYAEDFTPEQILSLAEELSNMARKLKNDHECYTNNSQPTGTE